METSAIAGLATDMSSARLQQTAEISVLKKALDIQEEGALALLEALPTLSSTGGVAGQVINVKV